MSSDERRQVIRTAVLIGAGLLLAWGAAGILRDLRWLIEAAAVAVFMSLAAEPAVRWAERRGLRREHGAGVAVVGLLAAVAAIAWVLIPSVSGAVSYLVENADILGVEAGKLAGNLGIDPESAESAVERLIHGMRETVGNQESQRLIAAAGKAMLQAASALFLFYYLLARGPVFRRGVLKLIRDQRRRRLVSRTWDLAITKTGGFLYGNLVLAIVCGVVTTITAWALGLPSPVGLGAWALVSSFVPILGGWLASLLPMLVAVAGGLETGAGFGPALVMGGVLLGFQAVDNYLLRPRVLSKTVDIPPVLAFLVVVGGASTGGVAGAVLAIPAAAIAYTFGTEWMRARPDHEDETPEDEIGRGGDPRGGRPEPGELEGGEFKEGQAGETPEAA